MVVLPEDIEAFDEPPEGERHVYVSMPATSDTEKRHVPAGMLTSQTCELYGQGVLLPEQKLSFGQDTRNLREKLARQTRGKTGQGFGRAPAWQTCRQAVTDVVLPDALQSEINAPCGLPRNTDLNRHWTGSDAASGSFTFPCVQDDMTSDPVACAAFTAVLLGPLPNNAHPRKGAHDRETEPLRRARAVERR